VAGTEREGLAELMRRESLPWRSLAGARDAASRWGVGATPTFVLVDHAGTIRGKWVGAPGEAALDAAIEPLVRAAEAAPASDRPK
jgi:hypothetical protein